MPPSRHLSSRPGSRPGAGFRPQIRAVVFDLDGTLIDSAPDIRAALNRTLAESGRPAVDLAAVKLMVGDGAKRLVAEGYRVSGTALDEAALAARYSRFLELYEGPDTAALTKPYKGVVETLARLAEAGYRLGICTNKPERPTADALKRLGLDRYFAAVRSPEQVTAPKPDPAHLRAVLDALGVAPGEAVYVGDNAHDVAVARAAGVAVIAVSYGYPRMDPRDLGADLLIDAMNELPEALARLGGGTPLP